LRATIEWSFELLLPEEQQLFARLSVFAGGCTLEAAEEVADADLDTLQSLVEKSLLRFTNSRYWMLETIREYAGELVEDGRTERRYVNYFAALASGLAGSHGSVAADSVRMERLDVESPNLRDVLQRLLDQLDSARALDIAAAMAPFWLARGRFHEGLMWVEGVLALDGADEAALRGRVLSAAADLSWSLGDLGRARAYATESLALAERVGEPRATAQALHDLAEVVTEELDFARAKELYEEAIRKAREVDYPAPGSIANLALIAFAERDYAGCRELLLQAIGIFRERSNQLGYATSLLGLACASLYCGDVGEARLSLRESIGISAALRYDVLTASCLRASAAVLVRTDRPREAASLLGASEKLLEDMHAPLEVTEHAMHDETQALIRAALDDRERAAAWRSGRELTLDEAVSLALGSLD
jgi:non-specific serine/threonine protein kinase